MSQVDITVRGRFEAWAPPERATARITVAAEGPQAPRVHESVTGWSRQVTEAVRGLHHPDHGPVTWWSSGQLRTWARRPWNKDGKQLPLVHHAQVEVEAKFSDFTVLSRWLAEVLQVDGVKLNGIDWALTERRRLELTNRVRTAAVEDARTKAQAYADALGLGAVQPVAVADAGMLARTGSPEGGNHPVAFSRAMAAPSAGGGPDIELSPRDIEVSTQIDARFLAG